MTRSAHILVVDDDNAGRYVKARLLRQAGFDVSEAADGCQTLREVAASEPDLVLLDVRLPDLDGMEVCRRIKETHGNMLVLQTSVSFLLAEHKAASLNLGADAYLTEPAEPEEFLATVRALLRTREAEAALRAALQEKQLLLSELQHRTKNNLQVVTSLLRLESGKLSDPEARAAFERACNRIAVMAEVYDQLYRRPARDRIDFGEYVGDLADALKRSVERDQHGIVLKVSVEPIEIGIDKAILLGLIANELLTNAFKYAFPGKASGTIAVELSRTEAGARMVVRDDGIGLPPITKTRGSGLQLVSALASQADAATEHLPVDRGTAIAVSFPL